MVVLFQESEDSEELEGVGWLAWERDPKTSNIESGAKTRANNGTGILLLSNSLEMD